MTFIGPCIVIYFYISLKINNKIMMFIGPCIVIYFYISLKINNKIMTFTGPCIVIYFYIYLKITSKIKTFTGPCIVIYFYSKNQPDASMYQIYLEMTLYMFRAVFSSIIGSSRLYMQQQVYVKQILQVL